MKKIRMITDYQTFTPWETGKEIREAVKKLDAEYDSITLIAGSIGAFFSMNAGIDAMIRCVYLISPVVDMEQLMGEAAIHCHGIQLMPLEAEQTDAHALSGRER